jgi:hypothetical protein
MSATELTLHTENHKFNKHELLRFGFTVTEYFETVDILVETYEYKEI